jgi:hypothetical protein
MDALFSRVIKAGKSTYFVDVKEAKNKSKYISFAESSPSPGGDGERKFTRKNIVIFDSTAPQLCEALAEAAALIKKE